jgi:hypothetical protein
MADFQEKRRSAYERGLQRGRLLQAQEQYWQDAARSLSEVLAWPASELSRKVLQFHRERLEAVPDLTRYPELRGYRDLLDEEERGLRDAGNDETLIALSKSLNFWRGTRLQQETGKAWYAQATPEKCRVLYLAESDRGALHLKNVDDPLTYWKPRPPLGAEAKWPFEHPLVFDGVGSGLHIDEIPPEIFPVAVRELCQEHCGTVPEAEEFLVRYNYFWGSCNQLVHDKNGNSVAFEKTWCRVATRGPNAQGINFITGMGSLDPELSAFQKQQRRKYLDQIGASWDDSPDGCFFTQCENKWKNMARYVNELSLNPTWENAKQLMEQRDPSGPMCLTGGKCHPDQTVVGYTQVMDIYEIDNKRLHRRQWRGDVPVYLDTPEIVQFV